MTRPWPIEIDRYGVDIKDIFKIEINQEINLLSGQDQMEKKCKYLVYVNKIFHCQYLNQNSLFTAKQDEPKM